MVEETASRAVYSRSDCSDFCNCRRNRESGGTDTDSAADYCDSDKTAEGAREIGTLVDSRRRLPDSTYS